MTESGYDLAEKVSKETQRKATENYFRVYHQMYAESRKRGFRIISGADALEGKTNGLYFLSIGFIPGTAVVLFFLNGKIIVVKSTDDLVLETQDELPSVVKQGLEALRPIINEVGEPTLPINGVAYGFLNRGERPDRITGAFPVFEYDGKSEPFGFTVKPSCEDGKVEVVSLYDPEKLATTGNNLSKGTTISMRNSGPIQKGIHVLEMLDRICFAVGKQIRSQ